MDIDRKTLKEEYKQQKIIGGIYKVTHTGSGRYLANASPDTRAKQNAFNFAVASNTVFDNRLRKDWEAFGGGAFTFEVLETLDCKKDQTRASFQEDLQALLEMWESKLDPALKY
jgi:hypothetical protein